MKPLLRLTALFWASLLMTQFSQAEEPTGDQPLAKMYVSDVIWLQVRSGPSLKNKIVKSVKSGEHLQVLGEDKEAGYTQVRTPDNREGWVLTRYLTNQPIAKEKLILANRELDNLRAETKTASERLKQLEQENKALKSERAKLKNESSSTADELKKIKAISADALALDEKTKRLTTRNQELEIQIEALRAENMELKDNRQQNYLIYGGGLVFAGILAGLILPSLRGRKQNSGWS